MSQDQIPEEGRHNSSKNSNLEDRITALEENSKKLEEENEKIKTQLVEQQKSGLPKVSRRQTLAGLLGGGLLIGSTGSASAQSSNGKPFDWSDPDEDGLLETSKDGTDVSIAKADQLLSESIPTLVRLYRDESGVAYALNSNTVIDSGKNHSKVIQSAIDWATTLATFPDDDAREMINGWVDGGGETFEVDQQIHLKDQVGLCNIDLNANNNDLGGDAILYIGPTGDRTFIEKPLVNTVAARKNGNGPGIRSYQQAWGMLYNLTASGNAGDGIQLEGGFVTVYNGHSRGNGKSGYYITNTGIAANINHLIVPNAARNGEKGIHADWRPQRDDDNDLLTIELGNFGGNTEEALLLGDGVRSAIVRGNWFEPGGGGIVVDGPNRTPKFNYIKQNITQSIDVRTAKNTILRRNFGPDYSGLDITITEDATDTHLKNNHYIDGTLTDYGVRTVHNDVGRNLGDPSSTGEWNGHGYEGVLIYDSSAKANRPWPAYRYIGGQWQKAAAGDSSAPPNTLIETCDNFENLEESSETRNITIDATNPEYFKHPDGTNDNARFKRVEGGKETDIVYDPGGKVDTLYSEFHWYDNDPDSDLVVYESADGGSSWNQVSPTVEEYGIDNEWHHERITHSSFSDKVNQVKLVLTGSTKWAGQIGRVEIGFN